MVLDKLSGPVFQKPDSPSGPDSESSENALLGFDQEKLRFLAEKKPVVYELLSHLKGGESPYRGEIAEMESMMNAPSAGAQFADDTISILRARENEATDEKTDREYLEHKLRGGILVDLGCGDGVMVYTAEEYGAAGYIGVDKYQFNTRHQTRMFESNAKQIELMPREIESVKIQFDMLDFVSRLPDNSVNFTMNGIDEVIIHHGLPYQKVLAKEIARALKKGGVIFGNNWQPIQNQMDVDAAELKLEKHKFVSNKFGSALGYLSFEKPE